MAKIPVRFKTVMAVLDEVSRARLCESSGSDHSPENSTYLSDLVKSFIERDGRENGDVIQEVDWDKERNDTESESFCSNLEMKDELRSLFGFEDHDEVKRNLQFETEQACQVIGNGSSAGFNRQLMNRLRERGFDAGLCKSKWEKHGRFPWGHYEYTDVNVAGTRYIIEVFLAGEFEIARPTDHYASLLEVFPPIYVGKVEELKQVTRIMCNAIKESMKVMDMHVPPWRKFGYMQAKWFGSYKRATNEAPRLRKAVDSDEGSARKRVVGTTNEAPVRQAAAAYLDSGSAMKRTVAFVPLLTVSYRRREDFASRAGLKVRHTIALECYGN